MTAGHEKELLLRNRAAELSRPRDTSLDQQASLLGIIPFMIAGESYAFELGDVQEVAALHELTPVPGAPAWIAGITHLHRQMLPVVDLRRFLGLPSPGITQLDRLVVLSRNDLRTGVLADTIQGVRFVSRSQLQAGGVHLNAGNLERITTGVVPEERIAVLDAERLLSELHSRSERHPHSG